MTQPDDEHDYREDILDAATELQTLIARNEELRHQLDGHPELLIPLLPTAFTTITNTALAAAGLGQALVQLDQRIERLEHRVAFLELDNQ